jgi:uncharacterized protein (DUF1778 family)
MAAKTTQISAHVSVTAQQRLDEFARATGVTRSRLIEDALLHHLRALEELPAEAVIPARVVLTPASAARVRKLLGHPPPPTQAMKRLFDDR